MIKDKKKQRSVWNFVFYLPVILTSGCNIEWEKPDLAAPAPIKFKYARPETAPPIPTAKDFVAHFKSPELDGFVIEALQNNFDIAAASARIRQADAKARMASAPLWPSVGLQNISRTNRTAGTTLNLGNAASGVTTGSDSTSALLGLGQKNGTLPGRNYGFFQLGIAAASYTIDFWGANEDASYASRILANASRFDRDTVEITQVSTIMNTYFQILAAQDRLRIAHSNAEIAERVYLAIKAKYDAGAVSELETSQQEAVLEQQRASIPALEYTLETNVNILAVLLGRAPESFNVSGKSLLKLHFPKFSPGLPSEVLLRRPDIARAEAQLASQEFSVLNARAQFFPSITLVGLYGPQTALISNLIRPDAIAWQAASQMMQPIFDGYYLQGNYENQKALYAELAALYRKQIMTALLEVENALISIRKLSSQLIIQHRAVDATRRAHESSMRRWNEGTTDIITLATCEREYFTAQEQEMLILLNYYQAASALYQALGGGWSPTTRNAEIARANAAYEENKGPWP